MNKPEETLQLLIQSQEPLLLKPLSNNYPDYFPKQGFKKIQEEALSHPVAQYWLNQLHCDNKLSTLHGSFDHCFENACGKCLQFGLTVHDTVFKDKIAFFHRWFLSLIRNKSDITTFSRNFYLNILAYHLLRAGYEDKEIFEAICHRLRQVYDFVIQDRYDLYISPEGFPLMPKNFQKKPLVDPKLFQDGMSIFPNVHDMIGFQYYYFKIASVQEKKNQSYCSIYCRSTLSKHSGGIWCNVCPTQILLWHWMECSLPSSKQIFWIRCLQYLYRVSNKCIRQRNLATMGELSNSHSTI